MFFVRPRILRDGIDATIETNAKYNYIRKQQEEMFGGKVPLMPRDRQPTLPELETMVPPELLDPARQAAPPGTTPAERAATSPGYVVPQDYTVPVPLPGGTPAPAAAAPTPTPPTTPFGTTPSPSQPQGTTP
jgi:hypothetical protein